MKSPNFKNKSGFTLVETLLAISVFSLSVVVMMSVLATGVQSTNYSQDKLAAGYLAQEGVEYIRNLRDTLMLYHVNGAAGGWAAFQSKLSAGGCGGTDGCYSDESSMDFGSLTETMNSLTLAACSSSCPILSYSSSTGKYGYNGASIGFRRKITYEVINNNEIKVTATVYWTKGSGTFSTTFSENLFNWIE